MEEETNRDEAKKQNKGKVKETKQLEKNSIRRD